MQEIKDFTATTTNQRTRWIFFFGPKTDRKVAVELSYVEGKPEVVRESIEKINRAGDEGERDHHCECTLVKGH